MEVERTAFVDFVEQDKVYSEALFTSHEHLIYIMNDKCKIFLSSHNWRQVIASMLYDMCTDSLFFWGDADLLKLKGLNVVHFWHCLI